MRTLFVLLFVSICSVALTAQTVQEDWVALYKAQADSSIHFPELPTLAEANNIAVDNSGNVYMTGRYKDPDSNTLYDFVTIKYNASGIEEWVATYNDRGFGDDRATAIAVDDQGNVYVTGEGDGAGTYYDYITIKYDGSTGTELWIARYNGPNGNSPDYSRDIAIDDSGNVYVTGGSGGVGTLDDYCTIKYDGLTGTELWVARYDGPDNASDIANAITLDGIGNVYITGGSRGYSNGHSTGYDYCTIKYDASTGTEQWEARYNNPSTDQTDIAKVIAVDTSGVYVSGRVQAFHYGYPDYCTFKYNISTGAEEWIAIYNGTLDLADEVSAIALDGSGNLYITGKTETSSGYDCLTIKYNGLTGTEEWMATYNRSGDDVANDIAIDNSGNVYVTGGSYEVGTKADYVTIKYDGSTGTEMWTTTYNGVADTADIASKIVLDESGNVYVTGLNMDSWIYQNFATIKYSQDLTSVNDNNYQPEEYGLCQNYPNPFNPSTVIEYAIPENGFVNLDVYNLLGEKVASLVNEIQSAGRYEIQFDASELTSGVYFYSIKSGSYTSIKKMMLLR